mmetsp:Transcript_33562/g.40217  ORF Transcript_33562/g.40217 Transcript_33562/m.40217 type:complete len:370 (+) Transcript_33562:127-1236(+)
MNTRISSKQLTVCATILCLFLVYLPLSMGFVVVSSPSSWPPISHVMFPTTTTINASMKAYRIHRTGGTDNNNNNNIKCYSSVGGGDLQNDDTSNNDDDAFMASLRSRVEEVTEKATKLPLVVLDSMLPRQVLKIKVVDNELLMGLIRCRMVEMETPTFGVLGIARLEGGGQIHLQSGVEVEIVGKPMFEEKVKGGDGGKVSSVMSLELRGGRRFVVESDISNASGGWTEARVKFFGEEGGEEPGKGEDWDRLSLARAMLKAREFTSPNMNMKGSLSLVDRWIQLARENERQPGQIDLLLEQLGKIPSAEEPSDCAFWIGALINPLPALGVAMEIRPSLLLAKTSEERVEVAIDGLFRSIRHMDGTAPMW